jgi:pimeloyl-ACP methyl ester carboxylesterase
LSLVSKEEKGFVAIGKGGRMYYEVKGAGEPILLIHGTPTSAFLWRKVVDELSSNYRVYSIDLPGWARSNEPDGFDYRLESYAGTIREFLERIGVESIILGVHDLGAVVGFAFLGRYPEFVSRLVILDTFAFLPLTKRLQWKAGYQFFLKIPLVGSPLHRLLWYLSVKKSDVFATLAFHDKKLATKELIQRYRELAISSEEADYRTFTVNGMDSIWGAVEKNLCNANIPTLIVWAENDVLFPISSAHQYHPPKSCIKT